MQLLTLAVVLPWSEGAEGASFMGLWCLGCMKLLALCHGDHIQQNILQGGREVFNFVLMSIWICAAPARHHHLGACLWTRGGARQADWQDGGTVADSFCQLDHGYVVGLRASLPPFPFWVYDNLCYLIATSTRLAVVASQPDLLHLRISPLDTVGGS